MQFLARELMLKEEEVESLLVDLIVMHPLKASIDKVQGIVILDAAKSNKGNQDPTVKYVENLRKLSQEFQTQYI